MVLFELKNMANTETTEEDAHGIHSVKYKK